MWLKYPNKDQGENKLTQTEAEDLNAFCSTWVCIQVDRIWVWSAWERQGLCCRGDQQYCVLVFLLFGKENADANASLMQYLTRGSTTGRDVICVFNNRYRDVCFKCNFAESRIPFWDKSFKNFFGVGFGVQLFCNNVIRSGPLFRANKLSSWITSALWKLTLCRHS